MTTTETLTPPRANPLPGLAIKALLALLLLALADYLFLPALSANGIPGATVGAFALVWLPGVLVTSPAIWASRPARIAAGFAAVFGLVLVWDTSPRGLTLYILALALAVLLPQADEFGDCRRWLIAFLIGSCVAPFRLVADALRLTQQTGRLPIHNAIILLPALGGLALFLWLFALANPVLDAILRDLIQNRLAIDLGWITPGRIIFWTIVLTVLWATFSPSPFARPAALISSQGPIAPASRNTRASITVALAAFNGLFALQNAMDVAFLWSGARLPDNLTLAQYAHGGAYPLMATVLIAAALVLACIRPGSDLAADRWVKLMIALWIAQNVFLTVSAFKRTTLYIESYGLTLLRLSALIWMALVAVGLALVIWRIVAERSNTWLVNAAAAAALATLTACAVIDLSHYVAAWNLERPDHPLVERDLAYIQTLGPAALLPVIRAEERSATGALWSDLRHLRWDLLDTLRCQQSDWRTWTLSGARRLREAHALLPQLAPRPADEYRLTCGHGPASGRQGDEIGMLD